VPELRISRTDGFEIGFGRIATLAGVFIGDTLAAEVSMFQTDVAFHRGAFRDALPHDPERMISATLSHMAFDNVGDASFVRTSTGHWPKLPLKQLVDVRRYHFGISV